MNKPRIVKCKYQINGYDIWLCSSTSNKIINSQWGYKEGMGYTPIQAYNKWLVSPIKLDS